MSWPGRWSALLILGGLCGVLFFYGLGRGDLYRTENLRAIIAADFLRGGDWVVPRLYGEPLLTKPPGMYAAIALLSWPFGGVSTWTARLPSALAATATVLLIYWYFARQFGRPGGLVAAALTPASLMWLDKVPSAEIDAVQTAWVTAAILFFLRALEATEDRGSKIEDRRVAASSRSSILDPRSSAWFWWALALLCVAGGLLTKWTAPVFFYATVVPLLWWRRRLRLLLGKEHLLSAALAAALCLAWVGAVVASVGWNTFADTVGREAMQRLSPGRHAEAIQTLSEEHRERLPQWLAVPLHPARVLATNLPWSAFALLTLWPGFARLWGERGRRLLQALHCWTWGPLLFWSVIPEHALRHSFPLFPGLTGLAALVWVAWLQGRWHWPSLTAANWGWLKPAHVLGAMLAVWLVVKVGYVEVCIPRRNADRAPRAKGELLATLVPPNRPLYVFHLKDEGIMFYFGRVRPEGGPRPPVQRLQNPAEFPSPGEPMYCILDEMEWRQWQAEGAVETLQALEDEQGQPIYLARVLAPGAGLAARQQGRPGP
jgi:4-amino-4-deoxy-L-arabinose transferase-like glycosyltransferase